MKMRTLLVLVFLIKVVSGINSTTTASGDTCSVNESRDVVLEELLDPARILAEFDDIKDKEACFNVCCKLSKEGCNVAAFAIYDKQPECVLLKCQPLDKCVWGPQLSGTAAVIIMESPATSNTTANGTTNTPQTTTLKSTAATTARSTAPSPIPTLNIKTTTSPGKKQSPKASAVTPSSTHKSSAPINKPHQAFSGSRASNKPYLTTIQIGSSPGFILGVMGCVLLGFGLLLFIGRRMRRSRDRGKYRTLREDQGPFSSSIAED